MSNLIRMTKGGIKNMNLRGNTAWKKRSTFKPSIPKNLKSYVRRQIAKKDELKQQSSFFAVDQPILLGNMTNPLSYFNFAFAQSACSLVQGTQEGERVANSITIKKMLIKGAIYEATNQNASLFGIAGPVIVDVYIGYRRDYQAFTDQISGFFRQGDDIFDPTGSTKDLLYNINDETYQVLDKRRMKIGLSQYSAATTTTAANFPGYTQHKTFYFNLTKYLKNKKIYYVDEDTTPINAYLNALTIWMTVINPTTGTPFPINGYPANSTSIGINTNIVASVFYVDS